MQVVENILNQMVVIPQGNILLRDDRTNRQWSESIQSFKLSKFPVTQLDYKSLMGVSPSTFKGEQLPVESVTWFDAIQFCKSIVRNEKPDVMLYN